MKAYVIYRSLDLEIVKSQLKIISDNIPDLELLILQDFSQHMWKTSAKKKIKEADFAIFFVGEHAHSSGNIDWELEKFIKYRKPIYTIKLHKDYKYNDVLFKKLTFGNISNAKNRGVMISKEISIDNLYSVLQTEIDMDISKDVLCHNDMPEEVMIEQYKAYLQTSEELLTRRQTASNFYITVNSGLLSIFTTVLAIINAIGINNSLIISMVSCYIISLLGVALCCNWKRLIISYGQLNAAKMKVIAAIEKQLPFNIYDIEWKVQTAKLGKRNYVSFTNIEKRIPVLFSILYIIVFLAAIVLTLIII